MTTWADQFNTYQDACDFYGCDGPREWRIERNEESIEIQDAMEARGGPLAAFYFDWEG